MRGGILERESSSVIRTIRRLFVEAEQDATSSALEGKAGGSPAGYFIRRASLDASARFENRPEPLAPRSSKMINRPIGCAFTVHWFRRQTKRDGASVFASSSLGHASDFWRCPLRSVRTVRVMSLPSAIRTASSRIRRCARQRRSRRGLSRLFRREYRAVRRPGRK